VIVMGVDRRSIGQGVLEMDEMGDVYKARRVSGAN
jgi:hypothetical protein